MFRGVALDHIRYAVADQHRPRASGQDAAAGRRRASPPPFPNRESSASDPGPPSGEERTAAGSTPGEVFSSAHHRLSAFRTAECPSPGCGDPSDGCGPGHGSVPAPAIDPAAHGATMPWRTARPRSKNPLDPRARPEPTDTGANKRPVPPPGPQIGPGQIADEPGHRLDWSQGRSRPGSMARPIRVSRPARCCVCVWAGVAAAYRILANRRSCAWPRLRPPPGTGSTIRIAPADLRRPRCATA